MKKHYLEKLLIFLISSVLFLISCQSECGDNTHQNEFRSKFTDAELKKWILFSDSVQYFKRTYQGKTDTVQGIYKSTNSYTNTLGDNGCYAIYYSEAYSRLFFPSINNQGQYISVHMNNLKGENYELSYMDSFYNLGDPLDTAFINGKLYQNVVKFYDNNRAYFLASGIGWIYINTGYNKFELIPK